MHLHVSKRTFVVLVAAVTAATVGIAVAAWSTSGSGTG
jgi:hypothetical protein